MNSGKHRTNHVRRNFVILFKPETRVTDNFIYFIFFKMLDREKNKNLIFLKEIKKIEKIKKNKITNQ